MSCPIQYFVEHNADLELFETLINQVLASEDVFPVTDRVHHSSGEVSIYL